MLVLARKLQLERARVPLVELELSRLGATLGRARWPGRLERRRERGEGFVDDDDDGQLFGRPARRGGQSDLLLEQQRRFERDSQAVRRSSSTVGKKSSFQRNGAREEKGARDERRRRERDLVAVVVRATARGVHAAHAAQEPRAVRRRLLDRLLLPLLINPLKHLKKREEEGPHLGS